MKLPFLFFLSLITTALSYPLNRPTPPTFTFLFTANITAGAQLNIGTTPFGDREIVTIAGGSFAGPSLNGKILGGQVRALSLPGGISYADATYVLETDDGATIVVTEKALVPYVEVVFETASEKYGWLNNATVWALDQEQNGQGTLNYWQLT